MCCAHRYLTAWHKAPPDWTLFHPVQGPPLYTATSALQSPDPPRACQPAPPQTFPPQVSWARRSLFSSHFYPLLLCSIFLLSFLVCSSNRGITSALFSDYSRMYSSGQFSPIITSMLTPPKFPPSVSMDSGPMSPTFCRTFLSGKMKLNLSKPTLSCSLNNYLLTAHYGLGAAWGTGETVANKTLQCSSHWQQGPTL